MSVVTSTHNIVGVYVVVGDAVFGDELTFFGFVDEVFLSIVGVGNKIVLVGVHKETENVVVAVGKSSHYFLKKSIEFFDCYKFYTGEVIFHCLSFDAVHFHYRSVFYKAWLVYVYDIGV